MSGLGGNAKLLSLWRRRNARVLPLEAASRMCTLELRVHDAANLLDFVARSALAYFQYCDWPWSNLAHTDQESVELLRRARGRDDAVMIPRHVTRLLNTNDVSLRCLCRVRYTYVVLFGLWERNWLAMAPDARGARRQERSEAQNRNDHGVSL